MKALYDADVDVGSFQHKKVCIVGFGSQGHAHALNLRDAGIDVTVGLRDGSSSAKVARDQGLRVERVDAAVRWGDIVMMLVPDELAPDVFARDVAPALREGAYLAFAHGFGVHYGRIVPPADAGVFLVAPKAPGHTVRREFARGRGVPMLVAVHQDPNGDARALALAYAASIGGGRAGILETTFREETETDLFGEQAVLCGGLTALVTAGFETLVEAGYAPEMAYFECVHELKLIVDLVYEGGLSTMRTSISNTAEYGDVTRGPRVVGRETRLAMRRILDDIRSGAFADEWTREHRNGSHGFDALRRAGRAHPLEAVGERLRRLMPWMAEERMAFFGRPDHDATPVRGEHDETNAR